MIYYILLKYNMNNKYLVIMLRVFKSVQNVSVYELKLNYVVSVIGLKLKISFFFKTHFLYGFFPK